MPRSSWAQRILAKNSEQQSETEGSSRRRRMKMEEITNAVQTETPSPSHSSSSQSEESETTGDHQITLEVGEESLQGQLEENHNGPTEREKRPSLSEISRHRISSSHQSVMQHFVEREGLLLELKRATEENTDEVTTLIEGVAGLIRSNNKFNHRMTIVAGLVTALTITLSVLNFTRQCPL